MKPERWRQIDELLQSALACASGERPAFLAQACAGDEPLRREVESLIASHEHAENFLEAPMSQIAAELFVNDQTSLSKGQSIGSYEIAALLGAGGMGEVYLAEDTRLRRKVALKLLPDYFTADANRLHRFEQEARSASSLNHPNIVTIYEIGQADGHHFIATEFIDGVTLHERMTTSPSRAARDESPVTSSRMKLSEALDVAVQVAEALAAAHSANIVHRDIKPENIMIRRDGYVKVLDFGLAKLTERSPATIDTEAVTRVLAKTNPGMVLGTVQYMSPEQARGLPVDERTDIWSLGVVLYEMAAGRLPFEGETTTDVILSVVEREPPPLAQYSREVPAQLERIVNKALRKNRKERYQTVKDLGLDLKSLKQELEFARLDRSMDLYPSSQETATKNGGQAAKATMSDKLKFVEHPASSAEYIVGQIMSHRRSAVLGLVALVIVGAALSYFWISRTSRQTETGPAVRSIAVLPFKSLSKDTNDDYLGLGIADTIIMKVSQNSELTVRPTSAVRKYANQETNSLEAARQLKVDSVLDGTVQRAGDRLRININLLRTQDGASLWSDTFNVSFTDIFKMQDEVSQQVATRLRIKLKPKAQISSVNPQAYDFYLRAKYHAGLQTEAENQATVKLLERAVQIDPSFAAAYAELAIEYRNMAFALKPQEREWEEKAYTAMERALKLDPDLAEAHVARGLLLWTHANHFPHALAVQEFRRALDLNPNLDEAHHQLASVYNHIGLLDKAEEEIQKAVAINPGNTGARFRVGVNLLYQGRDEQALAAFRDSEKFSPAVWAYQTSCALFHLGRREEAAARVAEALKNNPQDEGGALTSIQALLAASTGDAAAAEAKIKRAAELGKDFGHFHHTAYTIACAYALLNKAEPAMKWLRMAADDGFPCYPLFERDPNLNNLRRDQRFIAFMAKLKEQWERYQATL